MRKLHAAVLLLIWAFPTHATDLYDAAGKVLTIPTLEIGSATYSDVKVTVGKIVTLPSGSFPNDSVDRYDPVSGQLTVPSVELNNAIYYNAVVTVAALDSIGSISGADSYGNGHLMISSVQVANVYYVDVVLVASSANIVGVQGGMPLATVDSFSVASGKLTIPAVQAFGHVYTNVTLAVGVTDVASVGGTAGRFAYVANSGSGTISAYSIDRQTGALTALSSSPVAVPGSVQLYEARIAPSGKFLYVVDDNSPGKVYAFSIDQSSGTLTAVSGSPFAAGNGSQSLAFDATGAYLYVANLTDNTISGYTVNASTGALTELANSPYAALGNNPQPSQIVTAGNYLYVADSGTNVVEFFAVAAGTGELSRPSTEKPAATDTGPVSVAVSASGSVLFTANTGSGQQGSISAFKISSSTGSLTAVAGNPLAISAGEYISVDPHGKYLFVTEFSSVTSGVAVYPIDSTTGALGAAVTGSPFATGAIPYSVSVDPTDRFVYVGNDGSANVSEFTLDGSSGSLTPVPGSPIPAGANPDFVAIR
jgi:6-phosphogluconolactonase (cycloisomerase 2 family)